MFIRAKNGSATDGELVSSFRQNKQEALCLQSQGE